MAAVGQRARVLGGGLHGGVPVLLLVLMAVGSGSSESSSLKQRHQTRTCRQRRLPRVLRGPEAPQSAGSWEQSWGYAGPENCCAALPCVTGCICRVENLPCFISSAPGRGAASHFTDGVIVWVVGPQPSGSPSQAEEPWVLQAVLLCSSFPSLNKLVASTIKMRHPDGNSSNRGGCWKATE